MVGLRGLRGLLDVGYNHWAMGHRMNTNPVRIVTEYVHPPIRIRTCDWSAVTDNYGRGDPVGYGVSKQEAIRDLINKLEERDA